jgi:hypothetical protein
MSVDAMAESLNYRDQKRRAVASRSYRVKISPNNGQTFTDGQTINIDLPSNMAGVYCNWNQAYLKYKVSSSVACVLDTGGAVSMISRLSCTTSGAQVFDLPSWNVLMTLLMDADSSPAYKAGIGNVLMGTHGGKQSGESLDANTARTYCIPMVCHPFAMSTPHRLTPLFSSAPLQFKIVLESGAKAVVAATAPTLTFSEVELIVVLTELSPGSQAVVDQMCGGLYNILASSYQNVTSTMTGSESATTITANLGISVSSLERIIVCHRPTATTGLCTAFSNGHRIKNYLTEYTFQINGENYPARSVIVENQCAEALAEFLLSDHSLVNFDKQSSFNIAVSGTTAGVKSNSLDGNSILVGALLNPYKADTGNGTEANATTAQSSIGSFFTAVELESLSEGKSQKIYSGISTISSTVSYRGVYGANAVAAQIDFFAQFTVLLSLNTRGTNAISV